MRRRTFLASIPIGLAGASTSFAQKDVLSITGRAVPRLKRFDEVMRGVVNRHEIPGASLSLAKDGKLVYARGFGLAIIEGKVAAKADTPFALGSVSKSITAVAILKLIETGKLGIDDPALAILKDLESTIEGKVDPRSRKITIRMLLAHTAGYKKQPGPEVVARALGVKVSKLREKDLVRYNLDKPLDYDPGTEQVYSNFGYTMLGAIVEKVVGEPYPSAIEKLVLGPMGVKNATLGHGEPYGPSMAHRYGKGNRELPPLDIAGGSAGGWIAPTTEMVRFLASLNGARGSKFLSDKTMRLMLTPQGPPIRKRPNGAFFGLGWDVVRTSPQGPSYAKSGGLAGVRAYIGHSAGDVDWAVAMNGGSHDDGEVGEDLDAANHIEEAITQIKEWPEFNLFEKEG